MNKKKTPFEEKIGIDFSWLYGFEIESIDPAYLNSDNVNFVTGIDSKLKTKEGINIQNLTIKDTYFGQLKCGAYKNNVVTSIGLSVSACNNFRNLTAAQFQKRIDDVFKYVYEKYKVKIKYDFKLLYISKIEINITFKLNGRYSEYRRALFVLISCIPSKRFNSNSCRGKNATNKITAIYSSEKGGNYLETINIKNSSRELTIYNKSQQLRDTGKLNLTDDYMRIEYKLKRKDSYINTYLGETVADLTDENISRLFIEMFTEDIIKPTEEFKNKIKNNLKNIINGYIVKNNGKVPTKWIDNLLESSCNYEIKNNISMIIDYTDIIEVINNTKEFKQPRRSIKRLENKIDKTFSYLKNDNQKIDEIIYKIDHYGI